jgi:hypothetical protein
MHSEDSRLGCATCDLYESRKFGQWKLSRYRSDQVRPKRVKHGENGATSDLGDFSNGGNGSCQRQHSRAGYTLVKLGSMERDS